MGYGRAVESRSERREAGRGSGLPARRGRGQARMGGIVAARVRQHVTHGFQILSETPDRLRPEGGAPTAAELAKIHEETKGASDRTERAH